VFHMHNMEEEEENMQDEEENMEDENVEEENKISSMCITCITQHIRDLHYVGLKETYFK
jgi:hypothetical protein